MFILQLMLILLLIMGAILLPIYSINKRNEGSRDVYIAGVKYMGGFEDLEGGKDVKTFVLNDEEQDLVLIIDLSRKIIHKKDIVNVVIQTEQQLVQNINLGKIVAFGIFALGMKDTKSVAVNYVVLSYKDEKNDIKNIILQSNDIQYLYNQIKAFVY